MASIATLKLNGYFFMALLVTIFGAALFVASILLGLPLELFIILTIVMIIFQVAISSTVVKWTTGTKYLKPGENPFLEGIVREVADAAGVPMPRLGMVNDPTPNAFVFGISQKGSTLSVHRGLLEQLNRDEIKAVIAHEIGHIRNRDCMYMTFLSVIPLIAYMGMRLMWFSGGRRDKNAGALILVGLISIVVYFLTSLLIKKVSRIREYYADAYSGYITGDPHSLASALTKITYGLSLSPSADKGKNAARTFYIGDVQNAQMEMAHIVKNKQRYDLDGDGVIDENELQLAMEDEAKRGNWNRFSTLFATHPPTFKRILNLIEMEKELEKGAISQDNIYEKVEF